MLNQSNISSEGKPFPIEEADVFFRKLKETGKTSFKLTVSWSAIEHEGEGIYDEAYLAYLRKILLVADKEGISVRIELYRDLQTKESTQDELQERYTAAFKHLRRRLKNCKAVNWDIG